MPRQLWIWSITAALAGFLFGFDTVVISGADQQLQALWGSSDLFHGMVVMAMALWGTVIGALVGGYPTNRFGRKATLIWIGVLYTVSALGCAVVSDPYSFAFFRFIGGLGVGASTIAAPAYISEIAPRENRGKLVGLYQFNIVFGILVAFFSNYLLSGIGEGAWRWMLGIEAVPAIAYTFFAMTIPRSPRWLIMQGRDDEARHVLGLADPERDVPAAFAQMKGEIDEEAAGGNVTIFNQRFRFILMLAFLIAFFNQMSGINAILYYAPRIFQEAGLGESTALLSSIGVGAVNMIATGIGVYLINRVGRKTLMYIGSVGYIFSLTMVALAFGLGWGGMWVPFFLFFFIASHAVGQGTVIWVFISEIFPNRLRGYGQSFGSSVHWLLAAAVPAFIPIAFATIGPAAVFAIFAGTMVLQLLFVMFMMPETKGASLEDLARQLIRGRAGREAMA